MTKNHINWNKTNQSKLWKILMETQKLNLETKYKKREIEANEIQECWNGLRERWHLPFLKI